MSRQFHIVDVFAQERYAGNQLAVVTDAGDLGGERMQAIAAEIDYSETTFVTGPETDEGWPVRIFTPAEEVPFAGHPTLGTASVVRRHLADGDPGTVSLDLQVGEIPVEVRERSGGETLWMSQQFPSFGETIPHGDLATVLGLAPDQVDDDWPVQVVSTGLPTIVVPLTGRAAADLVVSRHAYLDGPTVNARVEQGYEMGRPSLLHLAARQTEDGIDVAVGGRVIPVARGELL